METCSSCGARLAPDAGWCNQCYARVRPGPAPAPGSAPPAGRLGWAAPEHRHVYSRLKAGPTSFGVTGRTMLSIGLLILVALGYPAIMGNIGIQLGWQSAGMYALASPVVIVPLMFRIWRPARIR